MRLLSCIVLLASTAACSSAPAGPPTSGTGASCTYPSGPYGTQVGDVVDPSLRWQGYLDDSASATTVSVADFFDCSGTKGVRALLLDQSATWCSDCAKQAVQIGPLVGGAWKDEGVRVVTLMAQDQQEQPATLDTAMSWRNEFTLTTGVVAADPDWTLKRWGLPSGSGVENGFPTDVVVDPRTMKIVAIQPSDLQGTIDNLARANQ